MSKNIALPLWSLLTGREFTLGAVRRGTAATLKAEQIRGKSTVPNWKGSHTQCFKKELPSKMDL